MKTEKATQIIAAIKANGNLAIQTASDGYKDYYFWAEAPVVHYSDLEDVPHALFSEAEASKLITLVEEIEESAKGWRWSGVEEGIKDCYRLLGAEQPKLADGLLYHRGEHPIQILAAALTAPAARYYAAVNIDRSGPCWGIGHTPDEATADAMVWLGLSDVAELTGAVTVEITRESYAAVAAGNPDAWEAVDGHLAAPTR